MWRDGGVREMLASARAAPRGKIKKGSSIIMRVPPASCPTGRQSSASGEPQSSTILPFAFDSMSKRTSYVPSGSTTSV